MKNAALSGKPYAGNPRVRFDEGEVASEKPRRGSLLYKHLLQFCWGVFAAVAVALSACGETVTLSPGDSIHDAVAAANAGDTIVLRSGTYGLDGQVINVDKAITICGETGNPLDVVINGEAEKVKARSASAAAVQFRCFNISAAATLSGLTVSNAVNNISSWSYVGGAGIYMTAGTVTNCVVTDCHMDCVRSNGAGICMNGANCLVTDTTVTKCSVGIVSYGSGICNNGGKVIRTVLTGNFLGGENGSRSTSVACAYGVGLCQAGASALTENCVITNNYVTKASNPYFDTTAVGAWVGGGEIRGTLIAGNHVDGGNGSTGTDCPCTAGLLVSGADTRAVNCTIADNTSAAKNYAAGVNMRSGSVINCVITGNYSSWLGKAYDVRGGARGTWTNNRVRNAVEITSETSSGNVETDATVFKPGTYELTETSNAAGAGVVEAWMDGTVDVAGRTRLYEDADGETVVDIGWLTWVPPPVVCRIATESALVQKDALSLEVSASVSGETEGLTYYWTLAAGDEVLERRIGDDLASFAFVTNAPGLYAVSVAVTNGAGYGVSPSPLTFTLVPSVIYFDSRCATPAWPYATPETAASVFADTATVADLADGITVLVVSGTNTIAKTTVFEKVVTVAPADPERESVIDGQEKTRILVLKKSGAKVRDLTFYRGRSSSETPNEGGGGVCALAGTVVERCVFVGCTGSWGGCTGCGAACVNATVRECVFRNAKIDPGKSCQSKVWGLGLVVDGDNALVERCVFSDLTLDNIQSSEYYDYASAGMRINAGTVRNCLFRRCRITHNGGVASTSSFGAAVCMTSKGALVNCTVIDCVSSTNAAVAICKDSASCKVENTIMWGNSRVDDAADAANWCGVESRVTYSCTLPAVADAHSISVDPCFKHPEKADGRISGASPCARSGFYDTECLAADTLDLYGKVMLQSRNRVPMGCVVAPPSGMRVILR